MGNYYNFNILYIFMPKIYKAWPGKNRFIPLGCITGPVGDTCANLYVYICIASVLVPYFIFMLMEIWKVSPAIPMLFFASAVITTIFLNLTQCTDPGIIPRRPFLVFD